MSYAIRFDFPELEQPLFAGKAEGAAGFAPSLRTADLYDDRDVAERVLQNAYGDEVRKLGRVVTAEVEPR